MSKFSNTHKCLQPNRAIDLDEIEELVSELRDEENHYLEILTTRLYEAMKEHGAPNFGIAGAREIVLRLLVKTNGAILE